MRRWTRGIALLSCFLLVPLLSKAESYSLFRFEGSYYDQVANYNTIIDKLRSGDELVFSDGSRHVIGELIGSGNTTLVYELKNSPGKLIRIPKARDMVPMSELRYTEYMTSFQSGEAALRSANVPIVNFYESFPGEYTVVERVPGGKTLREYLKGTGRRGKMGDALVEFARKTAGFQAIGDFHPDQLVFDARKKRWVLVDWTSSHEIAVPVSETGLARAKSIFVGPPEYRADFFFEYLDTFEPVPGRVLFEPRKSEHRWIATLANDMHSAIQEERIKRVAREQALPKRRTCLFSSLRGTLW